MGARASRRLPQVILVGLLVLAFAVGMRAWWSDREQAFFYQNEFGTAVSLACGQGFKNVYAEKNGVIASFTSRKTETILCEEAFSDENQPSLGKPNILQYQTISLQYIYGGLWRLFGIDWDVTALVTGLLLTTTTLAGYLFARQLLGVWPSLAVATLVAFAIPPLGPMIVHVRDFSKAPFVILLASFFVMILFTPRQRLVPLAALAALVTAVGIGFRTDVSLFLVLLPIAFLLRLTDRPSWRHALAALGVFIVVAAAYDWLILAYSTGIGRNNPHFVILGLASNFVRALGFAADHQGGFYWYLDHVAHRVVSLYAASASLPEPGYGTQDYDQMGRRFLIDILLTFPANELLVGFTATYKSLFHFIGRSEILSAGLLILVSFVIGMRFHLRGLAVLGISIILGGLMGLQFHPRHFFHLQVVGAVLLVACAMVLATDLMERSVERLGGDRTIVAPIKNGLVPKAKEPRGVFGFIVLSVLGLFLLMLLIARPYQEWRIATIIQQIGQFDKSVLPLLPGNKRAPADNLRVFDATSIEESAYLSVTQGPPDRCSVFPTVDISYESDSPYYQVSFRLVTPPGDVTGAYFPVAVEPQHNRVQTITVSDIEPGCRIEAAVVHPDSKFLPLVYFAGHSARPSYHESSVFDPIVAPLRLIFTSVKRIVEEARGERR